MSTNWRISSFNGALLAAYFIPTWTIVACKIMISPIHGLYERPNIAVGLFISDHLQLAAMATVRAAWLLALGKLTVVAFFAIFLALIARASIRKTGGCDEALAMAIGIGSVISFASMLMASQVGETQALRLHATELLMLLGTAIVLLVERPAQPRTDDSAFADDLAFGSPSSPIIADAKSAASNLALGQEADHRVGESVRLFDIGNMRGVENR